MASPSLLTRKSLSPQLKVSSLLNEEPWTSRFAFFCFFSFGAFSFPFSISGSSFRFCRTTSIPQGESLVNFLSSDGYLKSCQWICNISFHLAFLSVEEHQIHLSQTVLPLFYQCRCWNRINNMSLERIYTTFENDHLIGLFLMCCRMILLPLYCTMCSSTLCSTSTFTQFKKYSHNLSDIALYTLCHDLGVLKGKSLYC